MLMDDAGLWCQIECATAHNRAALFLDRDGVVVADTRYLGRAEDLRMLEGAALGNCALQCPANSGRACHQSIGDRARIL